MERRRIRIGYELYCLLTFLCSVCAAVCLIALVFGNPIRALMKSVGMETGYWTYAQVLNVGMALCLPYVIINMLTYKRTRIFRVARIGEKERPDLRTSVLHLVSTETKELKRRAVLNLILCMFLWGAAGILFWSYYNRNQIMVLKYIASPMICLAYIPLFCCIRNLLFSRIQDPYAKPRQRHSSEQSMSNSKRDNANVLRFHYDIKSNSLWVGTEEDILRKKKERGDDIEEHPPLSESELREKIRRLLEEIDE